jgi:hypothetical protein
MTGSSGDTSELDGARDRSRAAEYCRAVRVRAAASAKYAGWARALHVAAASEAATMGEILVRFTERVRRDGATYSAQVCGGIASDGLWDGWIEFAGDGGSAFRTPRETKQPNRDAILYWAEGLTAAYLEGALRRALEARDEVVLPLPRVEPSEFSGPAERGRTAPKSHADT